MKRTGKCANAKMDPKVFEFGTTDEGPGPAAYGHKSTVGQRNRMPTIPNEPAFTVKQRLDASDEVDSPGPVYDLAALTCRGKATAPRFSIGMKLPGNPESDSPGPAAYMPKTGGGRAGLKILLPLKHADPRAHNPGPNAYSLPSTLSRKAASLAKKIDVGDDIDSPGPALYSPVSLNKIKDKAPKFTLAKKFEDPLVANEHGNPAPGPQAYNPSVKHKYKSMPKFSFGTRRPDKFPPLVVCGDNVTKEK